MKKVDIYLATDEKIINALQEHGIDITKGTAAHLRKKNGGKWWGSGELYQRVKKIQEERMKPQS